MVYSAAFDVTVDPSGSSVLIKIRFVKQSVVLQVEDVEDARSVVRRDMGEGSDWTTAWVFQDCLIAI
jgi:hypothetical protein